MTNKFLLIKFKNKGDFRSLNKVFQRNNIQINRSSLFYYDFCYYVVITYQVHACNNTQEFLQITRDYIKLSAKNAEIDIVNVPNLFEQKIQQWGKSELVKSVEFARIEASTLPNFPSDNSNAQISGRVLNVDQDKIIRLFEFLPEIYSIINVTPDSFSDGGNLLNIESICQRIIDQVNYGADGIDLGAESTNPNSTPLTAEQEIARLKAIIVPVASLKKDLKFKLSVDTYHINTVRWLNQFDIDIINDVSGAMDLGLVKDLTDNGKKYIAMHNLGIPAKRNTCIDSDLDPLSIIINWSLSKIEQFVNKDINLSSVIIDPGIGFGKNASQSWYLIQNLPKLYKGIFPCELMLGHSRKSFISHVSNQPSIELDVATSIISILTANSVDYLRIHDMQELTKKLSVLQQPCFI